MKILKFNEFEIIEEGLPNQRTVDQLKMVRKLSKGIDIGDRISDMNKEGGNLQYIQNPIDSGIESIEDYERNNKKFIPNWNMKYLDPFSHKSKKKK